MQYLSTRGASEKVTSAEAIKAGLAPDGGLYVPESIPHYSINDIQELIPLTYEERALRILTPFMTDYTKAELQSCIKDAYGHHRFTGDSPAPIVPLNSHLHVLELWHGPTCAFKDMALQILPHFMVQAMKKTGEQSEIVILVATSGDTGKAALEGFKDVSGTRVIVFYPEHGVSDVQKKQMLSQEGNNVTVVGVAGNFDDTQTGVKQIFGNSDVNKAMQTSGKKFSSANSINWGRLVPQIVYYFSAYADMVKQGVVACGKKVNFVVPTGNFGNILAAWYAMEMGLPVNKLICASNENNVLSKFLKTGVYDKRRAFIKTVSPSMDILISSNLERLLFEISGRDGERVSGYMKALTEKGVYEIGPEARSRIGKIFWGGWSHTEETLKTIDAIYNETHYLLDTHTAVAVDVYDKYAITTGDLTPSVVVSTASPFKFNASVAGALYGESFVQSMSEFALLEILSERTGWAIPEGLKGLEQKKILHTRTCQVAEMTQSVIEVLSLMTPEKQVKNGR